MGAVDHDLFERAPETMSSAELADQLDIEAALVREQHSLGRQNNSYRMTVPQAAAQAAGHTLDNPGSVVSYWDRQNDLLIIDLNTDE